MLLAIDTSTRYAGVALWSEERITSAISWYSRRNHTAELMPAIKNILDRAETGTAQLDGIAVALGPGGFSALRVGLSVAKGLALPSGIPVVGISTLEIEAYPYADTGMPVCPLLDVGRGEVATALFQNLANRWTRLKEEHICPPEELIESIREPTLFCGEGVSQQAEYLRENLVGSGLIIKFHTPASRLWSLGILAEERLRNGDVDNLVSLQPLYLRRPSIGPRKSPRRVNQ